MISGPLLLTTTPKSRNPDGELYFLSIARNRVTLSSYLDDGIREQVETWAKSVPALG